MDPISEFLGECLSRMETIVSESAGRALTETETTEFTQLESWAVEARAIVDEDIARRAQLDQIHETLTRAGERAVEGEQTQTRRYEGVNVNVRTDPFGDLERVDRDPDLRGRAAAVIESHLPREVSDLARENVMRLVERESSQQFDADLVRAHIVASSSPAYVDAFKRHLSTGGRDTDPILLTRTAMSLTAANGGVLVPQFLDPTIVLVNAGTANSVRQLAGHAQITVDQWDGVTSAGVTAQMLAEGTEAADATPTFTGPTITVNKAAAWAFASFEVLMDSGFDEIGMLIADAFDRLEETQFTTGSAATGNCQGLITALSGSGPSVAGSSGAAGAADLVAADVYALDDALGARYRTNATFQANKAIYNKIRQLGTSNSYHAFWTAFGGGTPPELIGYAAYQNNAMDSTIVSGSNDDVLLLGDMRTGYKIVDRIGTTMMFEPLVKGSNQIPTGQAGWFAFKRFGGKVLTSDAFKLLRL